MKVNDLVKYSKPMADEVNVVFKVLEVNGDRVIMQAQVDMVIRPTYVAQVSDLEVI